MCILDMISNTIKKRFPLPAYTYKSAIYQLVRIQHTCTTSKYNNIKHNCYRLCSAHVVLTTLFWIWYATWYNTFCYFLYIRINNAIDWWKYNTSIIRYENKTNLNIIEFVSVSTCIIGHNMYSGYIMKHDQKPVGLFLHILIRHYKQTGENTIPHIKIQHN